MQDRPNCGAGEPKITAAILERPVIEKILTPPGWTRSHQLGPGARGGARLCDLSCPGGKHISTGCTPNRSPGGALISDSLEEWD